MNIKKLVIQNEKSFGTEVEIGFNNDLNIFIGPNAGGKSNFLDILNITLIYFFLHPWRSREEYNEWGALRRKYFENRNAEIFNPINQFLEKHIKRETESQLIKITFFPEEEDVKNINNIIAHQDKLIAFEKDEYNSSILKDSFLAHLVGFDINSLTGEEIEFSIQNNNPIQIGNLEQKCRIFLAYLNYFRLLNILIDEHNARVKKEDEKIPRLFPPLIYFSPYRIPQIQNLAINISGIDFFSLLEKYEKSHSKSISSSFEVANYYFARKFLYLNDSVERFKKEEEIKLLEKYIKKLGYSQFSYELINRDKNIYEGVLIKETGEKLEISKASSGEKEILNLLMGIFAFNIKNGVVIIDEPDLHLHPKWQKILLELFIDLSKARGIQFFIVTHSPHFITPRTIEKTIRVYSDKGESKVISSPQLGSESKDIIQIVNTLNNEKMFFADKVVLVEGIVDRLIFEAVLRVLQKEDNFEVIEIINVEGKENFRKFEKFLDDWRINSFIIADAGYKISDSAIFILNKGSIEKYFSDKKRHFSISDSLGIARMIENKERKIPQEFENIFKKIFKS